MEIQNLRLQLLHFANGNVKAAKEMENYVLGESTVHAETQTVEANEGNRDEGGRSAPVTHADECDGMEATAEGDPVELLSRCFICCMRKAIEEGGVKFN